MTRLSYVDIENFRGISSLRYEPKKVNVLIGRNNSGKTTILEAIYANLSGEVYGSAKDRGLKFEVKIGCASSCIQSDVHTYTIYNSDSVTPSDYLMKIYANLEEWVNIVCETISFPADVASELFACIRDTAHKFISIYDGVPDFRIDSRLLRKENEEGIQNIIYNALLSGSISETAWKNPRAVYDYSAMYTTSKGEAKSLRKEEATILAQRLTSKFLWSARDFLEGYRQKLSDETVIFSDRSSLKDSFKDSLRLLDLERIIKENTIVPNLERLNNDEVVYKADDGSYLAIPYTMHGDGFLVLLNLLDTIYDAKGGVLLIEEPENHMHPGYLNVFVEQLMTLAKELDVQVFLTTHSYDLIDEFARYPMNEEEEAMIQITNVVRRNGEHELYNHSPSEALRTMDEMKIDLRGT